MLFVSLYFFHVATGKAKIINMPCYISTKQHWYKQFFQIVLLERDTDK